MKWLSISGVRKEVERIRWPKKGEVLNNTGTVLVFVVLFGIFFVTSDFLVTLFIQLLGIGV